MEKKRNSQFRLKLNKKKKSGKGPSAQDVSDSVNGGEENGPRNQEGEKEPKEPALAERTSVEGRSRALKPFPSTDIKKVPFVVCKCHNGYNSLSRLT